MRIHADSGSGFSAGLVVVDSLWNFFHKLFGLPATVLLSRFPLPFFCLSFPPVLDSGCNFWPGVAN